MADQQASKDGSLPQPLVNSESDETPTSDMETEESPSTSDHSLPYHTPSSRPPADANHEKTAVENDENEQSGFSDVRKKLMATAETQTSPENAEKSKSVDVNPPSLQGDLQNDTKSSPESETGAAGEQPFSAFSVMAESLSAKEKQGQQLTEQVFGSEAHKGEGDNDKTRAQAADKVVKLIYVCAILLEIDFCMIVIV